MVNKQGETWTFDDLEIWQLGRKLRKDVSRIAQELPKKERYNLADQMV